MKHEKADEKLGNKWRKINKKNNEKTFIKSNQKKKILNFDDDTHKPFLMVRPLKEPLRRKIHFIFHKTEILYE